ncbi:MAG: ABC transporter ATP-binding protein [Actinomycetota bacterium]|jgi:branched-chain amino acid transport system ATP-binding protein
MFELRSVDGGYGDAPVVHGVTLAVPDSSVVAVLGPNGAGKTTLLRLASGVLPIERGRLLLNGRDVTGWKPHELAQAGLCHVPEGRGVFPRLTVRENLVLQAPAGREAEAIDRATAAFPVLGSRLHQAAGTMSGGEQQMLALARAYVTEPRVVLVDEVSMGLAPVIVDEIFAFFSVMAAEGTSLLLVEQYVVRALEIADFVYLLSSGGVSFAGEPAELDGDDVFSHYIGVS